MWYNISMVPQTKVKTRRIPSLTEEETIRFFRHVHIPSSLRACWSWQGARSNNGYGNFKLRGRVYKSHRIVYQWYYGLLSKGLFICHTCDTPYCCNPNHLFAGTQKENMRDRDRKKRNKITKLSWHEVQTIRQLKQRCSPVSQRRLAKWFGVSHATIQRILIGTRRQIEL
ncbi:MAG TPA: hypothetical protein ENI27_09240 [bacterium]|nr:hypothetical protein [bacterium]